MFTDHSKKFSTDNPVDYEQAFFSDVVCRVSRKKQKKENTELQLRMTVQLDA